MSSLKQRIGRFLIPKLPVSREVFDVLRYEANMLLLRISNRINPFKVWEISKICGGDDLLLNLGSGPFGQDGWINIDVRKMKNVTFTADFRKKIPCRNESVKAIRCEHVLEHFDIEDEAPNFLKECHRVLKTSSVLRIVVPDVGKFVDAYHSQDPEKWRELGFEMKEWDSPIHVLNHVFRQGGEHKFGYDFNALKKLVSSFGFEVTKQSFGTSLDPLLANDQANHEPYSLYIDCVKK